MNLGMMARACNPYTSRGLRLSPQPSPAGQLATVTPVPGSTPFSSLTRHCTKWCTAICRNSPFTYDGKEKKKTRADALHAQ